MKLIQEASPHPFPRKLCLLPLAVILCSGLCLHAAPQPPLEPSSGLMRWWRSLARHQVHVQTDDQGTLITESGWGGLDRTYQTAKDAAGRTHEGYWEKGQAKPVDAAVRSWAETMIRESRQVPPIPPVPPLQPVPPVPPTFTPGEAGQAALQRVQDDPRLIAMLGSPITMDAKAKGSITTWGPGEPHGLRLFSLKGGTEADLTLFLTGPKGSALLHARSERKGAEWSFSRLEAQSSLGGSLLNLLSK